jgi:hypothetical protein
VRSPDPVNIIRFITVQALKTMLRKIVAVLAILAVTLNAGLCLCANEEAPEGKKAASLELTGPGRGHRHAHPGADPSSDHQHPTGHQHSDPAHSGGPADNCGCSGISESILAAPLDSSAVVPKPIAAGPLPILPATTSLAIPLANVPGARLSIGPPRPPDLALHLAIHLLSL